MNKEVLIEIKMPGELLKAIGADQKPARQYQNTKQAISGNKDPARCAVIKQGLKPVLDKGPRIGFNAHLCP